MKFLYLTSFVLLAACGGRNHDSTTTVLVPQNEQPAPPSTGTTYKAFLRPLNSQVANTASGIALVNIDGDNFMVDLSALHLPDAVHMQHIHMGSRCPTTSADANSDGYIDAMEARAVSGPGIIPLDSDLDTQVDGEGNYPSGAAYRYQETASLARMMADLRQPELDSDTSVVRLGPSGNLNISNRVIIVQGARPNQIFPDTVASYNGVPAQDTIPVLCGEINFLAR